MGSDRPAEAGLIARARDVWEHLAGTAAGFAAAVSVTASPGSRLCPPGWAGIVVIGGAALATAPDHDTARLVEQALSDVPPASLAGAGVLAGLLQVGEALGPAALAYLDPADFRPCSGAATAPLELGHLGLREFLQAANADDLEESGMLEITTPAFAVREHGQVVAAAGYRDWPRGTAHVGGSQLPQRGAAAWHAPPPRRPLPTRSRKASCRNGGRGPRRPGASPAPWDSASPASR